MRSSTIYLTEKPVMLSCVSKVLEAELSLVSVSSTRDDNLALHIESRTFAAKKTTFWLAPEEVQT